MAKYVIVGNGVTGMRAAEVVRRQDDAADVVILTEEPYPFYRRPQLADFASGVVGEARLWAKKTGFFEEQRLDLRLSTKVVDVDVEEHSVRLADGGLVPYDRLLVATGRRVISGALAGADLVGVNHFKTLDEARAVRELEGAGSTGVVYGNGLVALELVRALTSAGFATTYLVPTDRLWPEVLDEDAAEIAASRVRSAGAELLFGAALEAVDGDVGKAVGLVLKGGEHLHAHIVGMCAEYAPALEFLPEAGAGLVVGPGYTTPWADVYAAGDVTVGSDKRYFNWLRSWRQGADAGAVLAGDGGAVESSPIDVLNMQVLGLSLVALGRTVVAYRSGDTEMRGDYPYGEFHKKLVFGPDDTLVGALLLGNIAEAGVLEDAIRKGTKKADLPADLLHQMFDVTYAAAYTGVQCPVCRHEIQLARGAAVGDLITCPVCGTDLDLAQGAVSFKARLAR
ncbi:MAG: FAD-dependent oxidoreductase [Thermoleophilia bacterium]